MKDAYDSSNRLTEEKSQLCIGPVSETYLTRGNNESRLNLDSQRKNPIPRNFTWKPTALCFIIVRRSHVASNEKHKWTVGQYKRTTGVTMRSESTFELRYVNPLNNQMALLKGRDFADQLDKLKSAIEYMLKEMEKLGDYELSEFTAKAGVEAGFWVLKANGSIEMKWTKAKKQQRLQRY